MKALMDLGETKSPNSTEKITCVSVCEKII